MKLAEALQERADRGSDCERDPRAGQPSSGDQLENETLGMTRSADWMTE